jgi:hypothetical protein
VTPRRVSPLVGLLHLTGAVLVLVGFLYSVARAWPSFDPLATAVLVGIGLLLLVVCERLRAILEALEAIADRLPPVDR